MEPSATECGVRLVPKVESQPEAGGEKARSLDFTATIDGQAIQQALVNLIDNAIKHSAAGQEVIVMLRAVQNVSPFSPLRGEGEDERSLCLSVEDNGPGIPPAEHEKIFERFYRLGSELRRETPGVGIGLSIVKHIVEAHRGRVTVESAPGKGSRFTIELPIDPEKELH